MPKHSPKEMLESRDAAKWAAQLEGDAIADLAASVPGGDYPLVLPQAHAQHGRALEETVPWFEFGNGDVVILERHNSEE